MFNVGDAVYHPTNGAGVIANLQRLPALSEDQRYYKINMLDSSDTVLMVPVREAENLGLRHAVSSDGVREVLRVLSSPPAPLPAAHKERYKLCQDKLSTANAVEIAEVVRDLANRQVANERLNVPGSRIYKKGLELLTGELAVAQGLSLEAAGPQIHAALDAYTVQIPGV